VANSLKLIWKALVHRKIKIAYCSFSLLEVIFSGEVVTSYKQLEGYIKNQI